MCLEYSNDVLDRPCTVDSIINTLSISLLKELLWSAFIFNIIENKSKLRLAGNGVDNLLATETTASTQYSNCCNRIVLLVCPTSG